MRYIVQLLIPALIITVVVLAVTRNRNNPAASAAATPANHDETGPLSTGTFMAILVIGAVFTVALVYALHDSAG